MIQELSHFLDQHIQSISIGLVATVLMIYGSNINHFFRKLTRKMHFWLRYALFILLCSAGYGFLSSQTVKLVRHYLANMPAETKILSVFGSFLILAFLARKSGEM